MHITSIIAALVACALTAVLAAPIGITNPAPSVDVLGDSGTGQDIVQALVARKTSDLCVSDTRRV